jgi:group I intron endonuclease
MIGIYIITSPTNKIYIGQSVNINNRKNIYKNFKSYSNSHGPKIFNSLSKHGFNNHIFEVIEECTLEQLNERETYWKQYYVNLLGWDKMLFCELYDNGGGPKSDETKNKIGNSNVGTKGYPKGLKRPKEFGENIKSKERNKKIGIGNKGKLKPEVGNKLRGVPKTQEHKQKISIKSKGISRNNKPVSQYDLNGNFIKEWKSTTEAANGVGVNQSCISDVLRGRQKQTRGFIFKFSF